MDSPGGKGSYTRAPPRRGFYGRRFVLKSHVEVDKKLVLVNSVSNVATRFINISVVIWLQQYLLRRITPEEYSLYPVLGSAMLFIPILVAIMTRGLGRYTIEAYAKGDDAQVTRIASTMFLPLCGAAALLLIIGVLFSWRIGALLNIVPERIWDARVMVGFMFLPVILWLPLAPFAVGLEVRQRFIWMNLIEVGRQIIRLGVLCALLFGVSTRVVWVVVASSTAEVWGLFVALVLSRRLVPALKLRWSAIHWPLVKTLISFGGWSFLSSVSEAIRQNSDAIILNKLSTAFDVTCFNLGAMPTRQLQSITLHTTATLTAPLTALHTMQEEERLGKVFLRAGRYGLWAALTVALPLMVYSREFVTLYVGPTFLAAAAVMSLLLAIAPLEYGNAAAYHVAYAKALVRPYALATFAVQAANLALTLYLVGVLHLGALGSALGTAITMITAYPLLMWRLSLKLANIPCGIWVRETLWPGLLPGIVAAPVWAALGYLLPATSWTILFLNCVLGGLCYIAVLFRFSLRDADRWELGLVVSRVKAVLSNRGAAPVPGPVSNPGATEKTDRSPD